MTKLYLYVVGACPDPDNIKGVCTVPWKINENEIFFGPCKKLLRERVRKDYIYPEKDRTGQDDETYIVGINAANGKPRKVIWAGRLREVMTFEQAFDHFQGRKGENNVNTMLDHNCSPMHVEPIRSDGKLIGYRHTSDEHKEDNAWVMDLVRRKEPKGAKRKGDELRLVGDTDASKGFPRDACMILDNVFFAEGNGILLDGAALEVLKDFQTKELEGEHAYKKRATIKAKSPFGVTKKGTVKGLRGTFLEMEGMYVRGFMSWLREQKGKVPCGKAMPYEEAQGATASQSRRCP